jgi:VWFA-related protein
MRKLPLLLLLAGLAFPAFAARRVTVEQLEQVVTAAHGKSDAEVARQLSDLELTERLSATRLARLEADLPGAETRQAVIALADVAAFLDLPATDIPDIPIPAIPAQRQLMAQTIDYVGKTLSKLPNFFATRITLHFEDTPARGYEKGQTVNALYQPLHPVGKSTVNILYRDGQEVVESEAKGKKSGAVQGLTTSGQFGPILATVLVDAAQGKLAWSHWEQGAAGSQAVFRYAIPKEKSHYQVQFCCVAGDNGNRVFQQFSGYHGEIAVDPDNGTILRLTLEADLKSTDPIVKANMLVEYGPVEIGGKSYLCPVKSISVSQVRPLHSLLMQDFRTGNVTQDTQNLPGPLQTLVNDAVFEHYHVFTASAHVLTGHDGEPGEDAAAANNAHVVTSDANASEPEATDSTLAGKKTASAPLANSAADASTVHGTASHPATNAALGSATPEINVTDSASPLDVPTASHSGPPDKGSSPPATARLVDVGVTAYDKKNHPITDLTPEDFEIYDNGRKQTIQSFNWPNVAATEKLAKPSAQFAYSNQRAASTNAGSERNATGSNVSVIMIDTTALTWAELTAIRGQILRFLRTLPANEHVAFYAMQAHSFQVIKEETADHVMLATKLNEWMPTSQDLTRAQTEENRNQQQTDSARNKPDLQTVQGTSSQAPNSIIAVDSEPRQFGSSPGADTLQIMIKVARHLAALPVHKDLVWVTGDNRSTAWRKPMNADKANKQLDESYLRAQEAMNDAHVTVYPLDASQPAGDVSIAVHPDVDVAQTTNMPTAANMQRGSNTVEMQPDSHSIQGPLQNIANATGGYAIHRSGDIAAALNKVVENGQATYLLGFAPDLPADGQYHTLDVKLTTRRGVTLRYRPGYQYARQPIALKDRFSQAIWQPFDTNEIGVSANSAGAPTGPVIKLNIATSDLALAPQEDRLVDNLDIFLVQRDDDGLHVQLTGKILGLVLKPATYQKLLKEGISFNQTLELSQNIGSVRIVVVDENSGRMGSVTLPSSALVRNP